MELLTIDLSALSIFQAAWLVLATLSTLVLVWTTLRLVAIGIKWVVVCGLLLALFSPVTNPFQEGTFPVELPELPPQAQTALLDLASRTQSVAIAVLDELGALQPDETSPPR